MGQGATRIVGRGLREGEEVTIRRAAPARRLGRQVLDRERASLGPFQVAVIRGEARQVLGLAEEAQQDSCPTVARLDEEGRRMRSYW
mgnify:FL=1